MNIHSFIFAFYFVFFLEIYARDVSKFVWLFILFQFTFIIYMLFKNTICQNLKSKFNKIYAHL